MEIFVFIGHMGFVVIKMAGQSARRIRLSLGLSTNSITLTNLLRRKFGCLARLSRRIASEFPYVGLGDAGNKTQCSLFKSPHAHDSVFNFIKRIDRLEKAPVFVVAVFKNLLDDVASVVLGIQR